jgi:prepilin-type N-terminal cleavage/methylation domain-containing protein
MSKINMTKKVSVKGGFTLLEILLVVGIISILAGIVILAINPTKQLGDTRNAQRRSDVLTILNAIYQYSIDAGDMATITDDHGPLADFEAADCDETNGTDALELSDSLATNSKYLVGIPTDPSAEDGEEEAEYYIVRDDNSGAGTGRITVCAPNAENDATIEVTR